MSTLTMQDIADLAKVSRPAVSQWRKRLTIRGVSMPFPDPAEIVGGVERFRGDDIVEWLERTGRGKSSIDAALDAPALTVPSGIALEDVVTLLAWHVMTEQGASDTTKSDRIEAALDVDGDDHVLLREIQSLDASATLLTFTDQLLDASFGPEDALSRLERGRLGRDRGLRDLAPDGVAAVRAVVDAAISHRGADVPVLRASGDPSLALAVCDSSFKLVTDNDDAGRLARRRAVIRGIDVDEDVDPSAVVVASLLGLDTAAALELLDRVTLELSAGQIAVIVGSGSVLADALAGDARARRTDTVKLGTLAAALRLPRGWWRESHRQNLAVWICRGGTSPQLVHLGDISRIVTDDLGDLTADIAGALAETARRAYRFTRKVPAADVALNSSVVPRGISAPVERGADSGGHIDRVHVATLQTSVTQDPLDVLVTPSRTTFVLNRRSLGEMAERNEVRVFRRTRIDADHADAAGTVAVLPDTSIMLDPIDAEKHYPRAVRTEVDDVIFTEKPSPRAWVDEVGGALVASPARILRLSSSAAVGPHLIAAVINTMAPPGSEWRTWRVPIPSPAELQRLEAVLAEVAAYERGLRTRAAAVRDLGAALIEGVAAGALSIESS